MISSCGPTTKEKPVAETQAAEQQAEAYFNAGDYLTAGAAFEALAAASSGNKADSYQLQAAEAYFAGGNTEQANTLLDKLAERELTTTALTRSRILTARIAIAENDAGRALAALDFSIPGDASEPLLIDYFSTRAEARRLDGDSRSALQDLDQLGQFLQTPDAIRENNATLWALLNELSTDDLTRESFAEQKSTRLIGWYDLAIIGKTLVYDPAALQSALETWEQQYPSHPASASITAGLRAEAATTSERPQKIALLLPFNDQYREASAAIREGFLAAWYELPGAKPALKIYDSSLAAIADVYATAINDGADFIVGPLQKDAVAELLQSTDDTTVPTLALNQLQLETADTDNAATATRDNFYQFSLLPEAEAIQVAERAWSEGHANALVITPDNSWGERIRNAFTEQWQHLGGRIIEEVRVAAELEDYGQPVKQLLNIDNSEERSKRLVATLSRNIISEPRYRRDADMIFMVTQPLMARQLVPQFRFYRADDIPTYSISAIYSGAFDPQANTDIDQVMFPDMPWLISTEHEYSPLQQALNRTWQQSESAYRRLYALGIDALQIIPELPRLRATGDSYSGKTGQLSVSAGNVIKRRSLWAQFVKGTPRLLDTKPLP